MIHTVQILIKYLSYGSRMYFKIPFCSLQVQGVKFRVQCEEANISGSVNCD
jgi:hypothetical protein